MRSSGNLDYYFDHHCSTQSDDHEVGAIYICPFCGQEWTRMERGGWMCETIPVEIIGVTLRFPDGSIKTFPG